MQPKAEHQLLVLLTFVNPSTRELELLRQAAETVKDWQEWYDLAKFNKTIPISYYSLLENQLHHHLPKYIWLLVKEEALLIHQKNKLRNEEAAIFLNQFKAQNIPVALLKGVAFGEIVYQNPAYKRMSDIDLLVNKKDIDAIYSIYDGLGYFCIGERTTSSTKYANQIGHLSPPFVSKNLNCVIGTQWSIKTPLSPYKINQMEIWNRVQAATFMNIGLQVLSPEDNLHHLCLHLGFFKISVCDLMDFYNLLRVKRDVFNWELFYQIVEESNTHTIVYFGLKLSQYVHQLPEVDDFIERIDGRVSLYYKNAIKRKTQNMDVFLKIQSDHIQSVERNISIFDSTSYFPEKVLFFKELWGSIFWPPKSELIRMCALKSPNRWQLFIARLSLPGNILKVIKGEIGGWFILSLFLLKTILDMLVSFFKLPFTKPKQSNPRAFPNKQGISLDNLITLKEQIQ